MNERPDTRGQSVTLDYVLTPSIGFLLITGLVVAGSDFISTQQERAQRAELRVIGQQTAAEVAAADRLVQAVDGDGDVRIERSLPTEVAGSGYVIEVVGGEDVSLRLATADASVDVRVDLVNETTIEPTIVLGGDVVVNKTDSGDLRIERGDRYA
jgi:hypothetical protein